MSSSNDGEAVILMRDEEILLMKCYRKLRVGQQMVLVELAQLMLDQMGVTKAYPEGSHGK